MDEKAIENDFVLGDGKETIRTALLPRIASHLLNLESLQKRAKH
jgi:hypothetical protein